MEFENIKKLALNLRILSIEAVEKANSGHPGLPLGAADLAAVLWAKFLRFNPNDSKWPGRDRFVLSAGHGSMLLYSLLHLFNYDLSIEELKNFRQWGSKTPGHPEFGITDGVETTTGPLGQGFANGVGMALSAKMLTARYSKELFEYKVYAIVSDGDLMEGVTSEAASLAGHLGLNNLIYLYDDNKISLADPTSVCFTESVSKRFEAYGWYVQEIDGHNLKDIAIAIENAKKESNRPSIICARTKIGYGSPNKEGTSEVHGAPLGPEEVKLTKKHLGWTSDKDFEVSSEVKEFCKSIISERVNSYNVWQSDFSKWSEANKDLAQKFKDQTSRKLPDNLKQSLLATFNEPKKDATRNLSGKAIQEIAKQVHFFIGGSADLEPSTKTLIKDTKDIQKADFSGKNIRFGVREHAMGSIVNGLAYGQNWIPFTATFLVFADYMRPTIRLAALSHLQSLFIFTHDSYWVGEDGPTHEPIEHISSLRIIPNLYVYRPADGVEVALCYYAALLEKTAPSALLFTRQNLSPLERRKGFNPDEILKGAYILSGEENKEIVLIASGSEVYLATEVEKILTANGKSVRVVSMPSMELFKKQSKDFQSDLIPNSAFKVSIEAGTTEIWKGIVGEGGLCIGIDHYGASAPGELLSQKFGFNSQEIANKILKLN